MRFRGLIATSNVIVAPEIAVRSNEDLLWITQFDEAAAAAQACGGGGGGGGN